LNQNGIGTLTLSGTGSSVGSVNVNAGTLNLAPSVALSTSGNYSTASGATTALAAGATLNVGGNFVQADGSTLALAVGGSQPEISATNVSLSGTLEITGVRYVTGSSASGLNSFQYLLIASANPISGAFQSITYGGATSTVDYITIAASALSTARQYYLSAGLTWLADATQSNGVFTLADGTVFNLDVSLANQPVNAGNVHGWDGETLTKEGNGTLILSQQNTYTGATNIVAGTVKTEIVDALAQSSAVAIAANATLDLNNYNQTANNLTGAGNVTLGTATLTVDNSSATTFAGTISGDGKLSKSGTASLTLSGVNSYSGGTTISAGTLIGSASSFGTGTVDIEGALVINQSTDANFSNEIIGAGSLTKEGAGTLTLLYDSALSGPTTVAAGTLAVTGTLSNSNVQVQSGATLSGYGTVGATTINSGGTIAPSQPGSVSTLTIAGNLTQQAGSIYRARVDPASSGADLLQVNGDVTLAPGAILQVQKLDPMEFILDTKYKVLNATGTLTGTYALTGDITSAFTRLEDSYDSQNVYLTVLQDVSFVDIATTPNQRGIADALQSLPDGNPLKEAVALLGSEEEARNAFRQLTGEMHASLQSQFMEQSHFERDVANDRLRQVFGATGGAKSDIAAADIEGEPYLGLGMVNPDASQVWGRVFGSWGSTSSDGNAAGADRSISGMFVGTDTHVSDDWRVGALAGVTHSRIRVGDLSSSADSDDYTLGLYAGNQWDALSLRVGTSYTWHNISSSRAVAFTGYSDQLNASYKGNTTQVFGELGYTLHHGQVDFEPFANVSLVQESTNGFTESGSYAALSARSSDMTTTFTTLGVRAATSFEVEGKPWTTHGMLGWRHAFGDTLPASQVNLAGSTTFTTNGVAVAGDTALLELSVDAAVAKNATLNIAYTGQVGSGVHDNGIRVNLTWGF
ncbi:autotransporter domain-containing protein, partial [Herbaspirillum sp. Sphag1AN]